jgi:hypothetical protein
MIHDGKGKMVSALITASSAPSGFQLQGDPPPLVLEMVIASQQGELLIHTLSIRSIRLLVIA